MAVFSYDIEQYMQCPGPIVNGVATSQCREIILKVINCTGANHGKRCQRVRTLVLFTSNGIDHLSSAMFAPTLSGYRSKMGVLPLQVHGDLVTISFRVNRHFCPYEMAVILVWVASVLLTPLLTISKTLGCRNTWLNLKALLLDV